MKVLHFADLHLGVETYGRIDPNTGLSQRFYDFLDALDQLVDFALNNNVDLILFCGDAYKNREPTQTQQREFARRINILSTSDIPILLLIGNHDLPNAIGRATATEIFHTLSVKNVYVANRPDIHLIPTKSGIVQVVTLPWPRRSSLLSKDESKNLNLEQINQRLQQVLTETISAYAEKIDPSLPSILAAHVWVSEARIGSEKGMTIGQEHVLLISSVANPAFDYVALGHIHKHQILNENPPVVYSGSLERLDFSDEDDDKGFYLIEINTDQATGKKQVSYDFHPVNGRRFLTIDINVESSDINPTATVLEAVNREREKADDAIVRLNISLPDETEGQLNDIEIRNSLADSYYLTVAKDIKRETRTRLENRTAEEVTPLDALKAWLETQKVPSERAKVLLEYGQKLIQEHSNR